MAQIDPTKIAELAAVANAFQLKLTDHSPSGVAVVFSEETLVVTMKDALTPAEKALARSSKGAIQVQDFHRQLFITAAGELMRDIERITGCEVREAAAEVEPDTGVVVHAFTTGTIVQVFSLKKHVAVGDKKDAQLDRWSNETGQDG